ncbi:hypothetical protein [uncultured Veillonella sp.]|uniref:hypothetical protein n=1 Tax=uncultured Veillonella sp. TaxID=159268 RepID=UPI0026008934|nr:hypothetical protein [uncultured Veillonella sp.]
MIFNAIKNLFNKDENAEQIEYLGTDKDGNKIYKVTIMSLREFLGFLIKLLILEKSFLRRFMNA